MAETRDPSVDAARQIAWPLRLTRAGMLAERLFRAFWPLWTVLLLALSALMLGLHDFLPLEAVWTLGVPVMLGIGGALVWGGSRFRWPS
ncbi:MAG: DUF4175 domain-containing protein, partial [Silicimonas sp.]|nr:DUF4175 domain-containing protein [Silicimonas sp.]